VTVKQWNNLYLREEWCNSWLLIFRLEILQVQSAYLCMCVYIHCQQYYISNVHG